MPSPKYPQLVFFWYAQSYFRPPCQRPQAPWRLKLWFLSAPLKKFSKFSNQVVNSPHRILFIFICRKPSHLSSWPWPLSASGTTLCIAIKLAGALKNGFVCKKISQGICSSPKNKNSQVVPNAKLFVPKSKPLCSVYDFENLPIRSRYFFSRHALPFLSHLLPLRA